MFGFGDLSGSHLELYAWYGMVAVVLIVLHDLGFRHLRRKYPEVLRGPQEAFLRTRARHVRIGLVLLAILGALVVNLAGRHADVERRRDFSLRCEVASLGLPIVDVAALLRNPEEGRGAAHERVVASLRMLRSKDPELRFAYVMALRTNTVIFLADAEDPASPDASAPGEAYLDASPQLRAIFSHGQTFVEGPLRDEFGVWVTAVSALRRDPGGPVLAVLGLDIAADQWNKLVQRNQLVAMLTSLFAVGVMLAMAGLLQWSDFARAQLLVSEARFRRLYTLQQTIVDSANHLIFSTSEQGIIRTFNRTAERLLGYRAEDVIGRVNPELFHDPQELKAQARTVSIEAGERIAPGFPSLVHKARGGHPEEREWTYVRRDGSRFPVLLTITSIVNEQGALEGFMGVAGDITDRRKAEQLIRRGEELKGAMVRNALDCVITVDHAGRVVEFNPAAEQVFGWQRAEVLGREMADLIIPPQHRDAHRRGIAHYLQTGEGPVLGRRLELTALRKDGEEFAIELSITPTGTPEHPYFTAYLRDISERRRQEEAIRNSTALLEAISRAQSLFISAADSQRVFSGLLEDLLRLTGCAYGFIGEVLYTAERQPYLKSHAITDLSWNEETRRLYAEQAVQGLEFHDLKSLFGQVLTTGQSVIANDPPHDPRAGGLPAGHPPLTSFLGLPLRRGEELVGMIGLANRPDGFDQELVTYLQPFSATGAAMIQAFRREQSLRVLTTCVDQAEESIVITDAELEQPGPRILFVNQGFTNMSGYTFSEAVGRTPRLLQGPLTSRETLDALKATLRAGQAFRGETTNYRKNGDPYRVEWHISPVRDAAGVVTNYVSVQSDITRRKAAEEALRRQDQLLAGAAEAGHLLLLRTEGFDAALQGALAALGQAADADRAYIFQNVTHPLSGQRGSRQRYEWARKGVAPQIDNPDLQFVPEEGGFQWWQQTLARGETISGRPSAMPPDLRELLQAQGICSLLVVPIFMGPTYWGFIGFDDCHTVRDWQTREISILVTAASTLGGALSRREAGEALQKAREREIEIGFRIQSTLLQAGAPELLTGLRVAARSTPSEGIDGDFFEFFRLHNRCVDVVVGDVMGKGVPAALLGAATKAAFSRAHMDIGQNLGGRRHPHPHEIMDRVSQSMVRQLIALESFVTTLYVRADATQGRLTMVNCGHTRPAVVRRQTGNVEFLKGDNLPLGFLEGERYMERAIDLAPGDFVLLYSDAITEAGRTDRGACFGEESLAQVLSTCVDAEPNRVLAAVEEAVVRYTGRRTFQDDFTCIVIGFSPPREEDFWHHIGRAFTSDLERLPECRAFLRDNLARHGEAARLEDAFQQLELGMVEALTNIMRHAYDGGILHPVWIDIWMGERMGRVVLSHEGRDFAPPPAPRTPDPTTMEPGGWGLYIIDQCVDHVHYGQDERGRRFIQLDKFWPHTTAKGEHA